MTVVCALGPAGIDAPGGAAAPDPAAVAAALEAGDDPVTLLADRVVDTAQAWRLALGPPLAGAGDAVLVHPSGWPPRRTRLVAGIAAELLGRPVSTHSRAALLSRPGHWLLEVDAEAVLISRGTPGGGSQAVARVTRDRDPGAVADAVAAALCPPGPVLLDAPPPVPGAAALAALIMTRLRRGGHTVTTPSPAALLAAAAPPTAPPANPPAEPADPARHRSRRRLLLLAAALLVAAAAPVIAATVPRPPPPGAGTTLIEGAVAIQVPADWTVRRITAGPGSPRLEVASPTNPAEILHVTQARSGADRAAAADTLRRAIAAQPAGVFVDFTPDARRADRPAITYRERRPGRDIDWVVLIEGRLRIGIGCQSAPGQRRGIDAVCDAAVASARGTGTAAPTSEYPTSEYPMTSEYPSTHNQSPTHNP
jgi:type VII secretion-associated protein (TIGR03931 family)